MNRRNVLSVSTIAALGLGVPSRDAIAQVADEEGVKAASSAFYAALMANDARKAGF